MKRTRKTVASIFLLVMHVLAMMLLISMLLFLNLYPPAFSQFKDHIMLLAIMFILCVGLPLLLFLFDARRFFTVITIDENGISRSLFGKFFKLSMKWDEIYEISYFESVMGFIMFSQTKSIKGMTYWNITKIKNLIQLQLTQKNYDCIKQYIKQPIIGLTDAKMAQLKLKK